MLKYKTSLVYGRVIFENSQNYDLDIHHKRRWIEAAWCIDNWFTKSFIIWRLLWKSVTFNLPMVLTWILDMFLNSELVMLCYFIGILLKVLMGQTKINNQLPCLVSDSQELLLKKVRSFYLACRLELEVQYGVNLLIKLNMLFF